MNRLLLLINDIGPVFIFNVDLILWLRTNTLVQHVCQGEIFGVHTEILQVLLFVRLGLETWAETEEYMYVCMYQNFYFYVRSI